MFNRSRAMIALALAMLTGRVPTSIAGNARLHNRIVGDNLAKAPRPQQTAATPRLIPRRPDRDKPRKLSAAARRVRQQAHGHNAASALWLDSQGRRWHTDSHGVHRGFYWNSAT